MYSFSGGGGAALSPTDQVPEWELDLWSREWVVEITGIELDEAVLRRWVVPLSIVPIAPNTLTLTGTFRLVGPASEIPLLIEASGDAWHLLGSVADTMKQLLADGTPVTVTGIDKGMSADAPSGGLQFEVDTYGDP